MPRTNQTGYTQWERLEPVSRNRDLLATLRMALADPLWLLARQRQFGEFRATDGGSPIEVDLEYEHEGMTRIQLGDDDPRDYDAERDAPLETLLEREPVARAGRATMRHRAETGMEFLLMLREAFTDAGRAPLPVPADFDSHFWLQRPEAADADGRRAYDVLGAGPDGSNGRSAPRVLDGSRIAQSLSAHLKDDGSIDWGAFTPEDLLPAPEGLARDASLFQDIAEEFLAWTQSVVNEPDAENNAWNPRRMENAMRASTGSGGDETVFQVGRYRGGRLDWYDFQIDPKRASLNPPESQPETGQRTTLPPRAEFRGMPAPRLWEFEDAGVNLSAVSAAGDDLSRLFMLEFMLSAGNDWFIMPIRAPISTLTRVTRLTVRDTFNQKLDVSHTARQPDHDGWSMYTFGDGAGRAPGLLLPATLLPSTPHSPTVERVVFARDGVANLMFGIEATFEGSLGKPIDRDQFARPRLRVTGIAQTDDPDTTHIEFTNVGDDELVLDGWKVEIQRQNQTIDVHPFSDVTLTARATLRLVLGGSPALDTATLRHAGVSVTLQADDLLTVKHGGRTLVAHPVTPPSHLNLDRYRLASAVADHWFPYAMREDAEGHHVLSPALLFDADALRGTDVPPEPYGHIIRPNVSLYEEEIPRSGLIVERQYQLSAWRNGRSYLWSGRRVGVGHGEAASGLVFDRRMEAESEE